MRHPATERRSFAVTMVTPGFRAVPGGVESHTSALAKELTRQGVKAVSYTHLTLPTTPYV